MSCKTNKAEEYAAIKKSMNQFRENKVAFQNFKTLLITPNLAIEGEGDVGACCGWRFYACVTLCAGTIEVFPLYLLCCGFCYDSYCCK